MPRFKDLAICTRLIDWSETSQIVALLTENHGLVRGLAKGSKRTSPSAVARYSGGIGLLTRGQIVGIIKPSAELANLTEWDLQESYWHLRKQLAAMRLACFAADMATALLADHDPHPNAFYALSDCLHDLADPARQQATILRFQWRILDECGYRPLLEPQDPFDESPDLNHNTSSNVMEFDPHAGGLVPEVSGQADENPLGRGRRPRSWKVRRSTLDAVQAAASGTPPMSTAPDVLARANRLLCAYARSILDRELPAMSYILRPGNHV